MPSGLAANEVRIEEYNPTWVAAYDMEERALKAIFGKAAIDIQHIGSTSVRGLSAKPVIDVLVGLCSLHDALHYRLRLTTFGYMHIENVVAGHHVFAKGDPRTHLLHTVSHGEVEWAGLIRFRDILRSNQRIAAMYESNKVMLAQKYENDRRGYRLAKSPLIEQILRDISI